jgi:hypothetical protein
MDADIIQENIRGEALEPTDKDNDEDNVANTNANIP